MWTDIMEQCYGFEARSRIIVYRLQSLGKTALENEMQ